VKSLERTGSERAHEHKEELSPARFAAHSRADRTGTGNPLESPWQAHGELRSELQRRTSETSEGGSECE